MLRSLLPAVAILAIVGASGCGGSDSGNAFGVASSPATVDSLRLVLSTRATTYGPGQPIPLRLTITNTAAQTAVLALSRPLAESFQITSGPETAYPPCPLTCGQPASLQIAPGQSQTVDITWDQHVYPNGPVPGGSYSASAVLPVSQLTVGRQPQTLPSGELTTSPLGLVLASPCPQDPVDAVPGQVEVSFAAGTTQAQAQQTPTAWGTVSSFIPDIHLAVLNLPPGKCVVDAVAGIRGLPGVASAEPSGGGCAS